MLACGKPGCLVQAGKPRIGPVMTLRRQIAPCDAAGVRGVLAQFACAADAVQQHQRELEVVNKTCTQDGATDEVVPLPD